jgi:hypothetical protein
MTPLPVILQDLLPPNTTPLITIESTGCLSQCDKGPNLFITATAKLPGSRGGRTEQAEESQEGFIHRVSDPALLADALQEYFSRSTSAATTTSPSTISLVEIPTTLRAAIKVMEQAQKGMLLV